MKRYLIWLVWALFSVQCATASEHPLSSTYLGSREGDPASLVENVSTIYGDYSEIEIDLILPAPDSLILSRFYVVRWDGKTPSPLEGLAKIKLQDSFLNSPIPTPT